MLSKNWPELNDYKNLGSCPFSKVKILFDMVFEELISFFFLFSLFSCIDSIIYDKRWYIDFMMLSFIDKVIGFGVFMFGIGQSFQGHVPGSILKIVQIFTQATSFYLGRARGNLQAVAVDLAMVVLK